MPRSTITEPQIRFPSTWTSLAWATLHDTDALDRVAAGRTLANLILETVNAPAFLPSSPTEGTP